MSKQIPGRGGWCCMCNRSIGKLEAHWKVGVGDLVTHNTVLNNCSYEYMKATPQVRTSILIQATKRELVRIIELVQPDGLPTLKRMFGQMKTVDQIKRFTEEFIQVLKGYLYKLRQANRKLVRRVEGAVRKKIHIILEMLSLSPPKRISPRQMKAIVV